MREAIQGNFPDWVLPRNLHVDGSDIALDALHEVFDVVWPKVGGYKSAVLESLQVQATDVVFYSDKPEPTPPRWPDRPRLDVVITLTDGTWVRWHPSAKLIWATEWLPTAAMKNRTNRKAKLLKALQ